MTKEFLEMIREEIKNEILGLIEYNEYARIRNELTEKEEVKKELGLPYRNNLGIPEKTEDGIIMSTYKKHIGEINEEDTSWIYYYVGTYKYVVDNWHDANEVGPFEELVSYDDPEADFRIYSNIEGIYSYRLGLKEALEFEKTHKVIYIANVDNEDDSLYRITKDFVITSVKEGQEKAKSLVLKKYNTNRE